MRRSDRKNKSTAAAGAPETAQDTAAEFVASSEEGAVIETEKLSEVSAAEVTEGAEAAPADGLAAEAEGGTDAPAADGKGKRGKKRGKHRKAKMIIGICAATMLCGTGLGIGLLFIPKASPPVNEGYGSVSIAVQPGETFSPDKNYSGLDIFGRLNYTFQQKEEWYSTYQGYVYTTVNQDVKTVKQFKDGRLISTDISTSSMVNVAREFCYIPSQDRVIWREASGGPSTYNGFDTPWKQGEPVGNMTISGPEGFKVKNGLPAYELSVYVFQENTILETEPVKDNGDGTYTVTYHLDPNVWKAEDGTVEGAAAYYANQMKFTGGLTDVPTFKTITISFTFNEKWENLKTEAHEEYKATMGFTVGCRADGITEYSYDTPYLPYSNDYETYFKQYAAMDATGAPDPTIDQMGALTSAFAPVINGPTTLSLDLEVGGKPVEGVIFVDLGTNGAVPSFGTQEDIEKFINNLKVRAKIGSVELYVADGAAYLQADTLKLKLTVSELMDLLGGLIGGDKSTAENVAENTAEVETEEGGNPFAAVVEAVLNHEKGSGKANAHADLDLGGLALPIDFNYFINEEKLTASLDNVHTQFTVGGVSLAATLAFTEDKTAPELPADTSDFVELADRVKDIVALIESGNLHADITFNNYNLDVKGGVDISFAGKADSGLTDEQKKEKVKVNAQLTVTYGGKEKKVGIAFDAATSVAYLDLDGLKLSANVNDAAALVKKFLALTKDESGADGKEDGGFSVPELVDTLLFTKAIPENLSVTDGEAATEILLKADALIGALGFDLGSFSLGDLSLSISDKEISLSSPTLGASIVLKEGEGATLTTDGYTDLANFVGAVSKIVDAGYLQADVAYSEGDIEVTGKVQLDIKDFKKIAAAGTFSVTYKGTKKDLSVIYTDGKISLDLDGVQLAADPAQVIGIVEGFLTKETEPSAQEKSALDKVLEKVFAFTFGELITAEQTEDAVTLTVQGTELLQLLGLGDVKLGAVTLGVDADGTVNASAHGVTIAAKAGTQFEAEDPGYADVTGFAQTVAGLIQGGYLAANVEFEGYGLTVSGNVTLNIKDFEDISAKGELTVSYGEAEKKLAIVYTGGKLYLDLDGLKLAAGVNDAIGIVKGFLAKDDPAAQDEGTLDKVLGKLFAFTFGDRIQVNADEAGDFASLTVQGTELLKLFDIDFKLGNVALNVTGENKDILAVSVTGGDIDVTLTAQACEDPAIAAPQDHVDLTDYAYAVANIIHGGYISAHIEDLAGYGLTATGDITLDIRDFNNISAKGTLDLTYNEAEKKLTFVYTDGRLYLGLGGLKLAANVNEVIAIVKGFLPADKDKANSDAEKNTLDEVLGKVFAFAFGEIQLTGKDDAVSLAVDGTELLKLFGVEFDLGSVALEITKSGTGAEATGSVRVTATEGDVTLGLTATGLKEADITAPNDYIDLTDYAKAIAQIVDTGTVSADLSLTYGGLTVAATGVQLNIADFADISAAATLTVSYGELTKSIDIIYTKGVVYLTLENMKLKADVNEAIDLIGGIVSPKKDAGEQDAAAKSDAEKLEETLKKVFAILCGDTLQELKETKAAESTADTVSLAVNGTQLLEALGVKFDLGNVTLDLTKEGVSVKAEGGAIGVTLTAKGSEVTVPAVKGEEYVSLSPVLQNLAIVLNKEAVCINGGSLTVTVGVGEEQVVVTLNLKQGVISWAKDGEGKNKLNVYVKASLIVKDTELPFELNITSEKVAFALGDELGVEIPLGDGLASIKTALLDVYNRIGAMVGNMLGAETENPLKEAKTFEELGNLLVGLFGVAEGGEEAQNSFDWTKLLAGLKFSNDVTNGVIASVELNGLTLKILSEVEGEEPGWLAFSIGYAAEVEGVQIDVGGELHVNTFEGTVPALTFKETMPIKIGGEEIKAFLGYLVSAIELLDTTDLTLEFNGKVTSTDEAYITEDDNNGVKYTVDAKMETHRSADSSLIHLDVDGKNLWVDSSVYAHASINVTALNAKDTSLYIDLFIVDGAPNKTDEKTGEVSVEGVAEQDGILDFYITLSQFGPVGTTTDAVPEYNPVCLYAPSSEILTILSAALPVLGVDVDILNNYMVSKWITDLQTVDQLKALTPLVGGLLGENVQNTIGKVSGILNKLFAEKDETAAPEPAAISEPVPATATATKEVKLTDYLTELYIGKARAEEDAETKTELTVTLNSNGIYGQEGLKNVQATLIKSNDVLAEDGTVNYGKFERFDLLNIYGNNCTENTTLSGKIGYDPITPALPTGSYQSFLGAEKLILSLVKSATHVYGTADGEVISGEPDPHNYVVNKNFYISGKIDVKLLGLVDVTIDLVAISVNVDENGELGINVRLKYGGKAVLVVAINGDSTVDITIKGGMVYMKRVQTTQQGTVQNKKLDTPITLYRAMPMANFTGDMLGQLGFILNFGEMINKAIADGTAGGGDGSTTPDPAAKVDFGTTLASVLKKYSFTEEGSSQKWHLEINGSSFSNGILGDVTVDMGATDGLFKTFNVTKLQVNIPAGSIKLGLTASLDLTWHNPGGISDGVADQTDYALAGQLADENHGLGGMIEKLNNEGGWTETKDDGTTTYKYLEAQEATVNYKYRTYAGAETDFDTPQRQNVMVSTGQGGWVANTLFSVLEYPELPDDGKEFYVDDMEHLEVGEVLRTELFAQQYKHLYTVKFWSEESLGEDWNYDEGTNKWWRKFEMEYGAKVTFVAKDAEFHDAYTVIDDNEQEVTLPARPAYAEGQDVASDWTVNFNQKGTEFKVLYKIDTVKYSSPDVAFTVEGSANLYNEYSAQFTEDTYTLITPSAEGYTFLGWYTKDADGKWSKVETVSKGTEEVATTEVQALWVSDFTVTITKAERSNKSSGLWKTYTYEVEAQISGGNLVGACANEVEITVTCSFDAYSNSITKFNIGKEQTIDHYPNDGIISGRADKVSGGDTPRAHVQIKYTFNGEVIYNSNTITATGDWKDV